VEDVCRNIACVLGVPLVSAGPGDGAVAQLGAAIAGRGKILLVLDNMDRLVELAAATVGDWLAATRRARYLVTSRERLRLRGEVVIDLAPLRVPPDGDDAVALFMERVRAGGKEPPRGEDAAAVSELVRRLDGLPLAIELAAARASVLTPVEMLARMAGRPGARAGDADVHHAALRAAIDWSWRLLPDWARSALVQCTVFRGGFSLEAARAVIALEPFADAPTILDALQELREKSLLRIQRTGETVRYDLYASVREFATEMQDADLADAVKTRHAAHYAGAAAESASRLSREGGALVMRHLLGDLDNLLAVIARGLDEAADAEARRAALRSLIALEHVFAARGPYDLYFSLLDRALEGDGARDEPGLLASVFGARGRARFRQGRLTDAEQDLVSALDRAGDDRSCQVRARTALACVHYEQGREAEARLGFERALTEIGDDEPSVLGDLLVKIGCANFVSGRVEEARRTFERALGVLLASGDLRFAGYALVNLAEVQGSTRQAEEARRSNERTIAIAREFGDRRLEAMALAQLGQILRDQDDCATASKTMSEAVRAFREIGDQTHAADFMSERGTVLFIQGELVEARAAYRAALHTLAAVANLRIERRTKMFLGAVEAALGRDDLSDAAFADAERLLSTVDDPHGRIALALLRTIVDAAAGRDEEAEGPVAAARPLTSESAVIRDALRVLDGVRRASRRRVLRIGSEARWFEAPGAGRTDLGSRGSLRLLLLRLADAHTARLGEPLQSSDLLAAGWPGERVLPRAGANRVRVALSTLRTLGLRTLLLSRPDGWLLDPSLTVVRDAS
jgi:predicted ATPase/predicted negative regulator of RcsB-dependent stress response